MSVWALSLAYRKNADRDEDKAKAYELEQVGLQPTPCLLLVKGPRWLSDFSAWKCLKLFTFNLLSLSLSLPAECGEANERYPSVHNEAGVSAQSFPLLLFSETLYSSFCHQVKI